jgi:hypothetical protein
MERMPFAIRNDQYSKKLKMAVFVFEDSEYIPEILQQFITRPPGAIEKIKAVDEILKEFLKPTK